jgi:hypothetical protein
VVEWGTTKLIKGTQTMIRKKIAGLLIAGLSLLVLGACSGDSEEKVKEKADGDGKVVATVNGKEILRSDYEVLLEEIKATYAMQGMDTENMEPQMKEQMETQVLDQLINTELLYQQATAENITIEEKTVNERFDEMKGQFEDEKKFQEALDKNKLTEETLKERIEKELLITQYLERNMGEIKVTDQEIQDAYDKYKEAMDAQEQEAPTLEDVKEQLKAQAISKKKQDKIVLIIQGLRGNNEIEIL